MNLTVLRRFSPPPAGEPKSRRSIDQLIAPLDALAAQSRYLLRPPPQTGQAIPMPRYLYLGERGGGDVVRLGIFATLHGDEPEGALALGKFLQTLERQPELGQGYALFIYPVCNPAGFELASRYSRRGNDLNREFWKESSEPEVRFIESEICLHAFHGIITLHSDDTADGLYGFVNGAVLSTNLLEPALRAGEKFLRRDRRDVIDGFPAHDGIIYESYQGVLRALPGLDFPPFELTLETPQRSAVELQVDACAAALESILVEYRYLLAVAQNI